MKKFLSLVLALVMTMSLVTVSAGAKEFKDDADVNYDEAVAVISEIGVVDGDTNGNFRPTDNLSRGAAAKIICNLILGPTTAAELKADTAPYKDVPVSNTFSGYIAYCAKEGIISGYADGSFRPAGTLTGYAFMKMLLGALGYDSKNEGYTGANWSINVAKQAIGIGLNKGLPEEFNGVDFVTREEAALYAFNTLKATMVDYEQKITTTINGIEVVISQGNEKPVTWSEGINKDGNIKLDGFVQFAEEFFPKLDRKDDYDDFMRPANNWVYDKTDIGTFARYDLLVESYTTGVTGKDLYDLLKAGVIKDNDLEVYEDGEDKYGTAADEFDKNDLIRSNNNNLPTTGDGVLTEVYLNTDKELITVVSINTYLAQATADYNESKEYAPLNVYLTDSNGRNFNVDVEDVANVTEVKEDTYYQVNVSKKDDVPVVKVIKSVEILEDATVTKYSAGNNGDGTDKVTKLTTGGEEYKRNDNAFYDDAILNDYNENLLTDNTYNVYVDQYGYFLGVDLFEGTKNYVFVTGYDLDGSHIAVKTAEAAAIFLDGTMKNIKVNVKDTNNNIDKAGTDATKVGFDRWINGDNVENNWYTYTVEADGSYTLKPCVRTVNTRYAQAPAGTNVIRTDNLSIVDTKSATTTHERVYGEDATVFLTVDVDDVSKTTMGELVGITDVTGVYTGVQNVDIEIDTTSVIKKADPSNDAYLADKLGGQVFAVYDSDYYVIAAVVLGEAIGANDNLAYILTGPTSEEKIDDTYYWTFDAIMNGEIQTFKAKSKYHNTIDMLNDNTVQELRFDGDYVTAIKSLDDDDYYGNDRDDHNGGDLTKQIDKESVYRMLGLEDFKVVGDKKVPATTLNLQGRTMYITADRSDAGLALASDAKAVTIQRENNKNNVKTEFSSVGAAIAHLADPDEDTSNGTQFAGNIYAILNDNATAAWVVFVSNTALNTGSGTGNVAKETTVNLGSTITIEYYGAKNEPTEMEAVTMIENKLAKEGYKVSKREVTGAGAYKWTVTNAMGFELPAMSFNYSTGLVELFKVSAVTWNGKAAVTTNGSGFYKAGDTVTVVLKSTDGFAKDSYTASVTGLTVYGSATTATLSADKTVMTITFKLGAMTGDVANWSVSVS